MKNSSFHRLFTRHPDNSFRASALVTKQSLVRLSVAPLFVLGALLCAVSALGEIFSASLTKSASYPPQLSSFLREQPSRCLPPPPQLIFFQRNRVAVEFYEITTPHLAEVPARMRAVGPADDQGIRRDALTSWSIAWRWKRVRSGPVSPVSVSAMARLVLPRWCPSSVPSEEEKREWTRYLLQVLEHEAGHVNIFFAHSHLFQATLQSCGGSVSLCSPADGNRAGQELIRKLNLEQHSYDEKTAHGLTQAARLRQIPVSATPRS